MKVSVNAISQICAVYKCAEDIIPDDINVLVEKIGAQLGAVDEVIDTGKKYQGVVVVKVVSCEQHPNADKLKVCRIDDGGVVENIERGEDGLVQVVCGAPNVEAGMFVAWLPPGSTVPESYDKDPFVLEARELRGVVSNGMIASAKELAIGENHEGILVIDKEAQPGQPFAGLYNMNDYIIDIENKMFTHRPDCFGLLGVAREIAGIRQKRFKSPDWYTPSPELPAKEADLPLEIQNDLPELVPRFTAVTMGDVEVKPSPLWLQAFLSRVGLRPINNIVDLTNYYMLLTGQPLHAYDYDNVKSLSSGDAKIVVRYPHKGEKVQLLNGKEIEPRNEAIMIATDQKAIGLGGVMGGAETEVDENTKNIILECANFDMYSIRRTSMAHGLFTDAVTRFNKGQSPLQNLAVLVKIAEDIKRMANAKVASEVKDTAPDKTSEYWTGVDVTSDFINARLGLDLTTEEVATLLKNVEFDVHVSDKNLVVSAPFWRTDIEIPEDIVEEVGRLYGYDKLLLELPKRSIKPVQKDPLLETKAKIRDMLAKFGANEVLTYSFVHGDLFEKTGQDKSKAFELSNALSPDLQYYRISLLPSLLEKAHPNIKAGYDEFALFEIGKSHSLHHQDNDSGLPGEDEILALLFTSDDKLKKHGAAYYEAEKFLVSLANDFGLALLFKSAPELPDYPITKPYQEGRSAMVYVKETDTFLGIIGELKPGVRKQLKLPQRTAGFEIDVQVLMSQQHSAKTYVRLPRFPKVSQDITLKVPAQVTYQSLADIVDETVAAQTHNVRTTTSPLDIYQREDDHEHKHVTFRIELASYEKTMRDEEVTKLLEEVAARAREALGAERV